MTQAQHDIRRKMKVLEHARARKGFMESQPRSLRQSRDVSPTGVPEGVFSVLVESTQGFKSLTDCPQSRSDVSESRSWDSGASGAGHVSAHELTQRSTSCTA